MRQRKDRDEAEKEGKEKGDSPLRGKAWKSNESRFSGKGGNCKVEIAIETLRGKKKSILAEIRKKNAIFARKT